MLRVVRVRQVALDVVVLRTLTSYHIRDRRCESRVSMMKWRPKTLKMKAMSSKTRWWPRSVRFERVWGAEKEGWVGVAVPLEGVEVPLVYEHVRKRQGDVGLGGRMHVHW